MAEIPPLPSPHPYPGLAPSSARGCLAQLRRLVIAVLLASAIYAVCVAVGAASDPYDGVVWGIAAGTLCCIVGGFLLALLRRRPRRLGDAPWERDRTWRRDGESHSPLTRGLTGDTVGCTVIGATVLWVAAGAYMPASWHVVVAAAIGVVASISLTRSWLQGGVQVRFHTFPMRAGTRVRIDVATTAGGSSLPTVVAILRCVEARRVSPVRSVVGRVLAEVHPATEGPFSAGPDEFVTIEFDVPPGAPGTDLSRRGEERHWELIVGATTAWGSFTEQFLVPIYSAETAPADARSAPMGGREIGAAHDPSVWAAEQPGRYDRATQPLSFLLAWGGALGSAGVLAVMWIDPIRRGPMSSGLRAVVCAAALGLVGSTWWLMRHRRRGREGALWRRGREAAQRGGALPQMRPLDLWRLIVLTGISAIAGWSIAFSDEVTPVVWVIAATIWLAATVAVASAFRRARRWGVEARWDGASLPMGSRITIDVRPNVRLGAVRNAAIVLRAMSSTYSPDIDYEVPPKVLCALMPLTAVDSFSPGEQRRVAFDLPPDAPGTRIALWDATHWELVVTGDTKFGPIATAILLPIYADPAAAAARAAEEPAKS